MSATAAELVRLRVEGAIAFLEINRVEALNALNRQVLQEIHEKVALLAPRKDVRVVIVSGAGEKAFVAGADIKEMRGISPEQALEFSQYGMQAFAALENLSQVTIAQVQGFALGGGLELALACDFIFASEKAQFGMPEVTLGLIPGFAGTQRLPRRIGQACALEWIASGQKYSALEAKSCSLVNSIFPPEELANATLSLAQKIAKNAPQAVQSAKRVIRQGMQTTLSAGCSLEALQFALRFSSQEVVEGMGAFLEKRAPQF